MVGVILLLPKGTKMDDKIGTLTMMMMMLMIINAMDAVKGIPVTRVSMEVEGV